MASTSSSKTTYDVFLSFRGDDTRDNFTSHLHRKLVGENIQTFIDDRLERGEKIESSLMERIEESQISVIVFSKGYASSPWCLDELVKILECRETMGQTVLPIFYHVDPSDVQELTKEFGDGFRNLEAEHRSSMNKWIDALKAAGNLSGWDWKKNRTDAELVEEVVDKILEMMKLTGYTISKELVGIVSQVDKVLSLLHIGSTEDVRAIGLWGLGGIGKTTIAEALITATSHQFDVCCFLGNVREKSSKGGIVHLKEELFSKLLGDKNLSIEMSHTLPTYIIHRLRSRKVIVVLDDVNDSAQLDELAGNVEWLGRGSRIIMTSRYRQVLNYKCDEIYEVKGLEHGDALQLLCLKAFKQKHPLRNYTELAKRAVNYAGGVPLALIVLGSHLCKRPPEEWEITLSMLKQSPNIDYKIQNILKTSYEELKEEVRDIFLDIACFFQGWYKDQAEDILISDYGLETYKWGIMHLKDKCLLTVWGNREVLGMHDLIRDLGREIAEQNGSRIQNSKIISRMLTNSKVQGKKAVQGMNLDLRKLGKVNLHPNAFSQMVNLRLFNFHRPWWAMREPVFMLKSGEIENLPSTLSLLCWEEYPCTSLPSQFSMENVVELDLSRSIITRLWDGDKCPQNLKRLNLSYCLRLMRLPDLYSATKLDEIDLNGCESLVEIDSSIKFLHNLTLLNVRECKNLKMLPEISRGIKRLDLSYSGVEEWSPSIQFLDNLIFLNMRCCQNITSLPINIVLNFEIPCRYYDANLYLSDCWNLRKLPEITGNIRRLNFSETSIEELPSCIGNLSSLEELIIQNCESLVILPDSICELGHLQQLDLKGCSKLEKFLPNLNGLSSLRRLFLDGTAVVELPSDIVFSSSLVLLSLNNCKRLQCLPKLPKQLWTLELVNCTCLRTAVPTLFILPPSVPFIDDFIVNYWNCVNLDENTRSKIMADAQFAITEYANAIKELWTGIVIVVPGSEIPEWYSYRSEGCSIAIQFPPSFFNAKFLAFAFCVVIDPSVPMDRLRVECKCDLKNSITQISHSFICVLTFYSKAVTSESDHVLLWSGFHDLEFYDWLIDHRFSVNEALFQFRSSSSKMKKCGVGLIYDKEDAAAAAAAALLPSSSSDLLSNAEYDVGNKRSRENEEEQPYPKRTNDFFSVHCGNEH